MQFAKTLGLIGCSACFLITVGCGADISSDYNRNFDFAKVHSYSWGQVKTENPLYEARVQKQLDHDLQAKGLQLVRSGGQLTIFATGEVHNQKELETIYNSFGPSWGGGWGWGGWGWGNSWMWGGGWGGGTARTTTFTRQIAALVVDMFDSSNKQLEWRGVITREVSDSAQTNIKGLNKALKKLVDGFPPTTSNG